MINVAINGFGRIGEMYCEPYMSGLNCGIDCASLLSMTLALPRSMPTYCNSTVLMGVLLLRWQ